MRRFIINFTLFALLLAVLYPVAYWAYNKYSIHGVDNVVYLWGDSQTYEGIDLKYLNSNSANHFYSAAEHGAGVYDFLVFTKLVPTKSNVIIQISIPALIRKKSMDRNISALDISSLIMLAGNHYSSGDIYAIVKKNILPNKVFSDKNYLQGDGDTIIMSEAVSMFEDLYNTRPDYLDDKMNLYLDGIKNLVDKKCKIIAIVFPFHPILRDIQDKSVYKNDMTKFEMRVAASFPRQETIDVVHDRNVFFDLTHLNARGARELTKQLAAHMVFTNDPLLLQVETSYMTSK